MRRVIVIDLAGDGEEVSMGEAVAGPVIECPGCVAPEEGIKMSGYRPEAALQLQVHSFIRKRKHQPFLR